MEHRDRLALFISYLFHPAMMPTFGVCLIFNANSPESLLDFTLQKYIYILIIGGTFVLPLCMLPIYHQMKLIDSKLIQKVEQRRIPLLVSLFFYFFTMYFLFRTPLSFINNIRWFMLASGACLFVLFVVSGRWKISLHAAGIGGIIGLVIFLYMQRQHASVLFLVITIILSGFIIWSRLQLKEHTYKQLIAGYSTGLVMVSLGMLLFSKYIF